MNRLRKNIGKQFHLKYPTPKKNQIPEIILNKECELSPQGKLQTTEEINQR
jgi:hypothetical protein